MKARVVLLVTGLTPGGAEKQVVHLARELGGRGWEVSIVSLMGKLKHAPPGGACFSLPIYTLGMRAGVPDPRALARLIGLLNRLRPQILHSHLFHANLAARVARLWCPVPVEISSIHSMAESGRDSERIWLRDLIYRVTGPLADCTTAVSRAAGERHASAGAVRRSRLRIVPNGVDTAAFRPDPQRRARVRERLGLGSAFVWLAAGRLMWKKDYPTLLRACAALGSPVVLIAGEGPQEGELRRMARDLGVDARFLGRVDGMAELMKAADGLVLSSVVEGLPVVLVEAAAGGLPAVATDCGGVREIVRDGETGFVVPPRDPAALAAAMSRLAALPEAEREAMSRAAREHAAGFDLAAIAAQWESLYRELLERAL
jgi:glycosyltransferase involved in cell wall biosynthesis